MLNATFYKFAKCDRSTKRPDAATPQKVYGIRLTEATSLLNPHITIIEAQKVTDYNYVWIPEFDRYYFVSDWEWSAGRWTATLLCDVLASWKPGIGESTQYVIRCSEASDPWIDDDVYRILSRALKGYAEFKVEKTPDGVDLTGGSNPFTGIYNEGMIVVGVVGAPQVSDIANLNFYAFTPDMFSKFMSATLGPGDWAFGKDEAVLGISKDLAKNLFNPFQYIQFVRWYPFRWRAGLGPVKTDINFGWWVIPGVEHYDLTNSDALKTFTMSYIPRKHPQAPGQRSYLNCEPYTNIEIMWPWFGSTSLDPSEFKYENVPVILTINIDIFSGECVLKYTYNNLLVKMDTKKVGCDLLIGYAHRPEEEMYTHNLQSSVRVATSGVYKAGINLLSGALETLPFQHKSVVETTGKTDSLTIYGFPPAIVYTWTTQAEKSVIRFGEPLCKFAKIDSLHTSGVKMFVKCENAEIDIPATADEIQSIEKFMNEGFYYE